MFNFKQLHSCSIRNSFSGFTTIELMIVIVIVALLGMVAAPSMSTLLSKMRIRSASSDFHTALLKARSEAVKRNGTVTVVPVGGNWNNGWIIRDPSNNTLDQGQTASGVNMSSANANVQFSRSGRVLGLAGTFEFDDDPNVLASDSSRCVSINLTGLPSVEKGACPP